MHVLAAAGPFADLDPAAAAAAVGRGWGRAAPQVQVQRCPQSDGGAGFLEALVAVPGAERAEAAGVPVALLAGTAHLSSTAAEQAREQPGSGPLGEALVALLDRGVRRFVVGVGESPCADGGRGLLAALAGGREQPLARARTRLAGATLVAAVGSDRVLLGLQGACASAVELFGTDSEQAQHDERAMGEWAARVRRELPGPVELLSGRPVRLDRLPGAGAGGGLGFGLAAVGAALRPGPQVVAEATGLAGAAARADLVVAATTVYDWRSLEHSVVRQVAATAAAAARPAVVLAQEVHVGRRETMALGLSGAYGLLPTGRMSGRGEAPPGADELAGLAARVAGTWTPARGART